MADIDPKVLAEALRQHPIARKIENLDQIAHQYNSDFAPSSVAPLVGGQQGMQLPAQGVVLPEQLGGYKLGSDPRFDPRLAMPLPRTM